jgi:hypothetical protein
MIKVRGWPSRRYPALDPIRVLAQAWQKQNGRKP